MAEILDILVSFLCQSGTANSCQSFIQNYPTMMEQLLYFFFLPTVLIIIFIAVVVKTVMGRLDVKYDLLLGIAIYIFIVLSGWYVMFLWLSNIWYILVIIIFGLLFLKKLFIGGNSGGGGRPGGKLPGTGGGGSITDITGLTKYGAKKLIKGRVGAEKEIKAGMKILKQKVVRIEKLANDPRAPHTDVELAISGYESTKAGISTNIKNFEKQLGIAGERIVKKYWDEISKLDDRVENAGAKEGGDRFREAA